ncbi:MAG TPA: tetratricopeptide repeat protein [Pyrinomonadaceae bacterium]|nr:tetratricopeptide repeat protein [Pyrinomonadaceae bacterium]
MSISNARFRIRSAGLTVLLMLFIAPAVLFAQQKEMSLTTSKEALAFFIQGRDKAENLQDAGTLFEQAIQKDPNFALAYLFAGRTNQEFRKNVEKAVSLVDKVSPGEKEWILAAKDQADGNPAGRKVHLEQLLKLHPADKRAHSQMGFYYRSIGDDTTALKHFNEAVKLDKKYAPAYNNIGYSNLSLGRYADSERAFKTYINLIPKNPNPYDSYAELLMKIGKYDESITQYNRALVIDPTFINSFRGIGNNYVYKGDFEKARASYQLMFDKASDDGLRDLALLSVVNSYVTEGKMDKALEANDRRLEIAEKAGDIASLIGIHTAAGYILAESGKLDDAAKHFEKADQLRTDPSLGAAVTENRRFGGMQNRARLLIARLEFDPAKAQLEEIKQYLSSRKNPNQDRGYNETAGFLELGQKNYAKALEYFGKADPNDPYIWYYQAVAQEGAGDEKSAAALYLKLTNWNQLDDTGYALVRSRAIARGIELGKMSN